MQAKKQPKHKNATAIGGIFIILALIGALALGALAIRFTMNLLDNQGQKKELERILTPIVMFDPVPFSDPTKIDNNNLLLFSMWTCLSDDNALKYERLKENKTLVVPASDLNGALYELFRDKVTLEHHTFRDLNETSYFYDTINHSYQVPTYGYFITPRPEVTEINKNGDFYDVHVKYIPPSNAWQNIYVGGNEADAFGDKEAIFTMQELDGTWYIESMRFIGEALEVDNTDYTAPVPENETTTPLDPSQLPNEDNPSTDTGTDTGSSTGTGTASSTGSGTGSSTDTGTSSSTGTGTGSPTGTGTGSSTGTGTGSSTGTGTGSSTGTGTGSSTGTGTSSSTGTGTGSSTGTDSSTGTGTGSSTGTGTSSSTGTGTGSSTGTDSSTGTGTRTDTGSDGGIIGEDDGPDAIG